MIFRIWFNSRIKKVSSKTQKRGFSLLAGTVTSPEAYFYYISPTLSPLPAFSTSYSLLLFHLELIEEAHESPSVSCWCFLNVYPLTLSGTLLCLYFTWYYITLFLCGVMSQSRSMGRILPYSVNKTIKSEAVFDVRCFRFLCTRFGRTFAFYPSKVVYMKEERLWSSQERTDRQKSSFREADKSCAGINEVNYFSYISVMVCTATSRAGTDCRSFFLASISNEISGPFWGSVDKVPFSHTKKSEETTTTALTSLKFSFLLRQESQWVALLWPVKWKCLYMCVWGGLIVASVCSS